VRGKWKVERRECWELVGKWLKKKRKIGCDDKGQAAWAVIKLKATKQIVDICSGCYAIKSQSEYRGFSPGPVPYELNTHLGQFSETPSLLAATSDCLDQAVSARQLVINSQQALVRTWASTGDTVG
jgi:hypothetical protein